MKKTILFLLIILFSCDSTFTEYNEDLRTLVKENYQVVVIDSCEYIFLTTIPIDRNIALTHKGNCKNCKKILITIPTCTV